MVGHGDIYIVAVTKWDQGGILGLPLLSISMVYSNIVCVITKDNLMSVRTILFLKPSLL